MKIISGFGSNYPEDPVKYFDFDKLNNINFYYGLQHHEPEPGRYNIILDLEMPQFHDGRIDHYNKFDKVLCLCPYNCELINRKNNFNKWIPVFFPTNTQYSFPNEIKTHNVCYFGLTRNPIITDMTKIADPHGLVTGRYGGIPHEKITHQNLNYYDKMKLIASSKINLIHNTLYLPTTCFPDVIISKYYDCEAYKYLETDNYYPQLKSRGFEAAFNKSLMLVLKDRFNVFEKWFEPEKEFIYFTIETLDEQLKEILSNYNNYQHVIDRAYDKAINNYTTQHFIEKYVNTR